MKLIQPKTYKVINHNKRIMVHGGIFQLTWYVLKLQQHSVLKNKNINNDRPEICNRYVPYILQSSRRSVKWRMLFVLFCIIVSSYCIVMASLFTVLHVGVIDCSYRIVSYRIVLYLLTPYRTMLMTVSYHIVSYRIVIESLCTVLHIGGIDDGFVQSTRGSVKLSMYVVCIVLY